MMQKLNYNVCQLCCIIESIEWLQRSYGLQKSCGWTNGHAVYYTTKSRDSEQTSFCARYSEKRLKILKITKHSEHY